MNITIYKAAEALGVSAQTVRNYVTRGVLSHTVISGHSYVNADEVEALRVPIGDVEEAKARLEAMRQEHEALTGEWREKIRILRHELRLLGTQRLARETFYLSLVDMLGEDEEVTHRMKTILQSLLMGDTFEEIGEYLGLTRERVRQLAEKAIRKAAHLIDLRTLKEENARLKQENETIRTQIRPLLSLVDDGKTDDVYALLVTPVNDLELSVRTLNCLKNFNLKTVGDIARMNKSTFMRIRNMGRKTITEVEDYLASVGLCFGYDVDAAMRRHLARA